MCAYGLVSIRSAERCSSKRYLFIINMSINESPAVCVCVGDERGISFFFDGSRRGGRGLYVRMPSSERPSWTRDFDGGHKYRSATLAGALLFECICFRVDLALASRKILASHILCGHWSHLFDSDSLVYSSSSSI
jgi:hypothetical protein